jgi:hypothetical protein
MIDTCEFTTATKRNFRRATYASSQAADRTARLNSSEASVYGADQKKIASIKRVMSDKVSYAVLSFGGFLGIGNDYYPLPWQSLKYDTQLGGYLSNVASDKFKGAPKYADNSAWNWGDAARTRSVKLLWRAHLIWAGRGPAGGSMTPLPEKGVAWVEPQRPNALLLRVRGPRRAPPRPRNAEPPQPITSKEQI